MVIVIVPWPQPQDTGKNDSECKVSGLVIPAAFAAWWKRRLSWRVVRCFPTRRPGNSQRCLTGTYMVVMAESTRRLVGNLFELQDLATRQLKGIDGPVRAWAALRARLVESRFEAMHATGLATLVGRDEEVDAVLS